MAEYGQGIVNQVQVNLDVATVELTTLVETSTSISPATYYCNFPADTFSSILAQVMETDAQIVLSSGTFSEPALIDLSANIGLALVGPAVFPPITQFDFSLQASAPNIRLSHLEIYGTFVNKSTDSSVSHCLFEDTVNIRQCNRDIHFDSCEFRAPITVEVSFAPSGDAIIPVVTFNNCDFRGTSFVLNQTYPYQVVFRGCRNFANFSATNARYIGINTLTDGNTIRNNITELEINGETKIENYVYTAGASGDPDYWSAPFSLPTNTVKNNMLIASETGELSWTPAPVSAGTYYCMDGVSDLSAVLAQVGEQQGAQIIMSSGSFGGSAINVVADNLAIVGPNCAPPIVELIRAVTVSGTRIRMTHIQFDGVATLTGNGCRYSNCDFPDNVIVGSATNTSYITLENCEFASSKTLTVNALGNTAPIYFINCNIGGATVVVNSASPLQVIFNNCAGFLALPSTANATLVGLNVLASGVINNSVQRTILASGRGTAGQVLLSGGASANDTWGSAPADATKYNVSGGNITGDVTLSATKSITADIINIKTLNIGSPQYITASTGVINATASITKLSPTLNTSQAVTIANGTVDGFVKFIEIIDSNATSITITGANLHYTISFTSSVGAGGQGAILVWDNDSEFWIVTALNNGSDPLKYNVSGGNITGDVSLSATKSITADIININNVNIKASQNIGVSGVEINVVNTLTRIIQTNSSIPFTNDLPAGETAGFIKIIQKINSNPTGGANATITSNYFNLLGEAQSITLAGVGACVTLLWDSTTQLWRILSINSSVLPQGFSVSGDITINSGYKLDIPRVLVAGSAGTAGQVLTSGGAGVSSWTTVSGGGGVSSVVAGTYIGVDSATPSAPVVSLALPTCDTDGKVLSSLTDGTLSWITAGGGSTSYAPVMFEVWVGQDYGLFSSSTTTDTDNNITFFNKTTAPANNNGATIQSGQNIVVSRSGTYRITMTASIFHGDDTMLFLVKGGVKFYSGKGLTRTSVSATLTGTWLLTVNDFDSISFGAYTSAGNADGWGGPYYQRPGFETFNYPIVNLVVDLVS